MKRFCVLFYSVLILLVVTAVTAQETAKRVIDLEAFDLSILKQLTPTSIGQYGMPHKEIEKGVFECEIKAPAKACGVLYSYRLNKTEPVPLLVSLSSKAENVEGTKGADYSIYVDLVYADGSSLWGQKAFFSCGTHDWETKRVYIAPTKPVRFISFYGMFRNLPGKVWFKDFRICEVNMQEQRVKFDNMDVWCKSATIPERSIQIRDVKKGSDYVYVGDVKTNAFPDSATVLDLAVQTKCTPGPFGSLVDIEIENPAQCDRCITVLYSRAVDVQNAVWYEGPRAWLPAVKQDEYKNFGWPERNPVGATGELSYWPFGVVGGVKNGQPVGYALGITPGEPCFYRVVYNSRFGELYVAADMALTPEVPKARLRFIDFDPKFAKLSSNLFRGAIQQYFNWFPEAFDRKVSKHGIWMAFRDISTVENWQDFGFRVKEGTSQIAWDDEHDILTFRYTEPMTWWMAMKKGVPRTYEAAIAQARDMAAKGNRSAQALLTSGHFDSQDRYSCLLRDTPWCDGAVWSICDVPGLEKLAREGKLPESDKYPVSSFAMKWNKEFLNSLYDPNSGTKGCDGEYIDSAEGYVTAILDYNRKHFPAMKTPLLFDRETKQPGIFKGFISYEYTKAMADELHARGKLVMSNGIPGRYFWLVPLNDVGGTETNWLKDKVWKPMSGDEMIRRRALFRYKPYCFLMNTDFDTFDNTYTEKYMKRCLAHGLLPSFFSPAASSSRGHYFSRPEIYNRARPLFKRYVPLCCQVSEAGWEPLTFAKTDVDGVYVERFGKTARTVIYTVFNDTDQSKPVEIEFETKAPGVSASAVFTDKITSKRYELKNGRLSLTVGPEEVVMLVPGI